MQMAKPYDAGAFAGMPPARRDEHPGAAAGAPPARSDAPAKQIPAASSSNRGSLMKAGLFVFFILTRALHPLLIDASKTDGKILYAKNTPVAMNKVITVVIMNLAALAFGGVKGLRQCWQPQSLLVFGMIGVIYALGDFLEMLSMSSLSGGVYQVLLQTKLLITACMLWWLKGSRQTSLQWHVLFAMFLAMSAFVLVDMDSSASGGGGGISSLPLGGVTCTLLKVAVSCYCAVLSEKYLKAYKDLPIPAKISGLSTTWALASMMVCLSERQVREEGFFAHWDQVTCFVTLSFVVKTVSTMYLLQALDSVQKNIGEALAVVVIYVSQVALPGMDKSFELSVFLLALLVVICVRTYLLSGAKKDAEKPKGVPAKRVKLVSLDPAGTPCMTTLGFDTLRCEASESLPDGVFYGILGDAHPVCGFSDAKNKDQCELMLLSQPHGAMPLPRKASEVPYLPNQSLTVLGQVRSLLPKESLSPGQFLTDCEAARKKFVERCAAVA
mmetsp:Transcript_7651/g.16444  ORF Transcript_7651/g.16444 Transcript_7651/m.16444 type:complete len:498 (-) Transcript_7651:569-2062(-)